MRYREAEQRDQLPQHRTRRPPRPRIGLNVTAMIDVVFLLLIYFLSVTNFKLGEEIYRLDLPQRGHAEVVDPFQLDEEPLRIAVISTGIPQQPYRLHIDGPYPQPNDAQELYEFLQQRKLTPQAPGGLFTPDHPIIIEPTSATRWEHVIDAFNAAARAEFTNVTFAEPTS